MKRIRLPALYRTICFLVLCSNPVLFSQEKDVDDWKREIGAVVDAQQRAWNDGNIKGYMEGYWKSDTLLFTSGGTTQRGWLATLEKYSKSYDTKEKMGTLKFSNLEFYRLSPEAAWVFGTWELERSGDHPAGLFTLIFRKFPDRWKIVHDHTSSFPTGKK